MRTIGRLIRAAVNLACLSFLMAGISATAVGAWFLWYASAATRYNQEELARAQEFNSGPPPALPTLERAAGLFPTETFTVLPDETGPVGFALNGETFKVLPDEAIPAPQEEPALTPLTPEPTPIPLPAVVKLTIARLGIDSSVEGVGLVRDPKCLETSVDPEACPWYYGTPDAAVGWQSGSGVPGEGRTIEFNAHVRWEGKDGVFRYLRDVVLDDEVILTTEEGAEHTYLVRQVLVFPATTSEGIEYVRLLEARGEELVIMITCAKWSAEKQIYLERLVVVAVKQTD